MVNHNSADEELEQKSEELKKESTLRKRAEMINHALFKISAAISTTASLDDLYESIHHSLNPILDTKNFFIALYDKSKDAASFPYCVDEVDGCLPTSFNISQTESLTSKVIQTGLPMLVKKDEILSQRSKSDRDIPACSPSEIWLGVPLIAYKTIIGVMAVQSYTDPNLYDQTDMDVMISVAGQIALAIERKRAEEALQESNERYRALADATFEAIFISEKGLCIDTNQTATNLFGYSTDELIGIFGTDVIAPEYRKTAEKNMLSGYEEPYEVLAQRKDGTTFYAELRGKQMNFKGRNVRVTVVHDIHKRKLAEETRERLIKELQDALSEIKTLRGILPICSSCKKVRDDRGYWKQIESYIRDHSEAEFTHGICPECLKKLYPDFQNIDEQ